MKIQIVVDGMVKGEVSGLNQIAYDQLLGDLLAQMEECPHGGDWENCDECATEETD